MDTNARAVLEPAGTWRRTWMALTAAFIDETSAAALPRAWPVCLDEVRHALQERNVGTAMAAWRHGYAAALASGDWRGIVALGDAALRIGDVAGMHTLFFAAARDMYLQAFVHARRARDLEGVLRIAQAFGELGEREVVDWCVRIARELAGPRRAAR
ncbi:MAG: hypothetical protein HYR86_08280 [Candidatus Rokubacteria bacterium]|nr:hypothetical protein [Candidatus Rokubacteria bacterium]